MSKLVRKTMLQFGSTANAGSEIGQFGSYAAPVYSNDPDVIQAGTAWPRGWVAETVATNRPFLEDFNAIDFVFSYMLCYLLEMGLAEYDAATTYYTGSRVQYAGIEYVSLADNNINHTPGSASSVYWQAIGDVEGANIASASSITLGSDGNIFKITGTTNLNTVLNPNGLRKVTLYFSGILTVGSSGNVGLNNGNFTTSAGAVLVLVWNGSSWFEESRSPSSQVSGFGNKSSVTLSSNILATTDGIVEVNATLGTTGGTQVLGYTDSSPTPSTLSGACCVVFPGSGQADHTVPAGGFSMSVKKGEYYRVVRSAITNSGSTSDDATVVATFRPLGS